MSNRDTFYITTPIYYVNDVPHIVHAYTTVAADVLARYWRLRGRDVFFLTGLDKHGQKVQQAAAKAGIDPQAHCDRLAPQFTNLWERLNISHNAFIRTTDNPHQAVVQRYLQQLFDKQLIYKADYTGWYCTFDERFWTEKDVADGLCPDCKRPIEKLSEHNYFFKMGQYQDRLIEHIKTHPNFIRPESRRNEVLGFLQTQKLGDLSISRPKSRLSWGIELPFDTNYVTYVWFDALVNAQAATTAIGTRSNDDGTQAAYPNLPSDSTQRIPHHRPGGPLQWRRGFGVCARVRQPLRSAQLAVDPPPDPALAQHRSPRQRARSNHGNPNQYRRSRRA